MVGLVMNGFSLQKALYIKRQASWISSLLAKYGYSSFPIQSLWIVSGTDTFNRRRQRATVPSKICGGDTAVQRRQSGLKSGESWLRVNKISTFQGEFPRNFDFFRQFH